MPKTWTIIVLMRLDFLSGKDHAASSHRPAEGLGQSGQVGVDDLFHAWAQGASDAQATQRFAAIDKQRLPSDEAGRG
jgi:hypothetical protein